jgi:hypothetical protein
MLGATGGPIRHVAVRKIPDDLLHSSQPKLVLRMSVTSACVKRLLKRWIYMSCYWGFQDVKEFPQRGGANGSIRFYPEIKHNANAGQEPAPLVRLY